MERGCHVVRRDESVTDSASFNDLAPATPTPWRRPRRRWLRYSLRSLLILTTVLCIWLGIKVNQARRQKEAVARLKELGAEILYSHQRSESGRSFDPRKELDLPRWLRQLTGDDFLCILRLFVTSNCLASLARELPMPVSNTSPDRIA
jgi:hypothetical protein